MFIILINKIIVLLSIVVEKKSEKGKTLVASIVVIWRGPHFGKPVRRESTCGIACCPGGSSFSRLGVFPQGVCLDVKLSTVVTFPR